jgi:lysophospholipase L1-like esterase
MTSVADHFCLTDEEAAHLLRHAPWRRLAVLGDSLAAGVGEVVPGYPAGGWADGIARVLRRVHPELAYLNLGQRDLRTAQIRAAQLGPALDFGPDLAAITCGGNDILRRRFDAASVEADLDVMVGALRAGGSDVLTFGLMDITASGIVPPDYAPTLSERLVELAELTRRVSERHGAIYLRMTEHPAAADPATMSVDLMHTNSRGHAVLTAEIARRLSAHC